MQNRTASFLPQTGGFKEAIFIAVFLLYKIRVKTSGKLQHTILPFMDFEVSWNIYLIIYLHHV